MFLMNWSTLKWSRIDGGREYGGQEVQNGLSRIDIMQEVTMDYSPESNGNAERVNRTLMYIGRNMIQSVFTKGVKCLWAEAIYAAHIIKNMILLRSCEERCTSYESNNRRKPDLPKLKIFGCQTFVHIPKMKQEHNFTPDKGK